ncbi:MAG: hypothetical protein JW709_07145 [Sedimentisphaerales bacterium]|nr:hypothetical protein [Sedimentisphaerales bacterium]
MDEFFENTGSVMFIMIFSIPIVGIIAHYWHEIHKTRSNNELKQSMLDRGMSAEEIERVLNAGSKSNDEQ